MGQQDFDNLLQIIGPSIAKQDTVMREAISPGERLALTLRYLATGDSYQSLMFLFRISDSAICKIVPEVCNGLRQEFLRVPQTENEWSSIAKDYNKKWDFPNCIGAMDGKHIVMKAPPKSGSIYYNYKGSYSIVLLALVDANYKFIFVDVGANGRVSDGGVYNNSQLATALQRNDLNIPPPQPLPHCMEPVPHVIVADDAFALKPNLMKPFSHKTLTPPERVYNYRLSRARRVVENVFGIAASKFRILLRPIELNPNYTRRIVLAICALHNYLITRKSERYTSHVDFDTEDATGNVTEGNWRRMENIPQGSLLPVTRESARGVTQEAKRIQEIFKNYFLEEGEVPFQYNVL